MWDWVPNIVNLVTGIFTPGKSTPPAGASTSAQANAKPSNSQPSSGPSISSGFGEIIDGVKHYAEDKTQEEAEDHIPGFKKAEETWGIVKAIEAFMKALFELITDLMTFKLSSLRDDFKAVGSSFTSIFTRQKPAETKPAATPQQEIKHGFSDMVDGAENDVKGIVNGAENKVAGAWHGLTGGVSSAYHGVGKWLGGFKMPTGIAATIAEYAGSPATALALAATAKEESNFNPQAKNPGSSAAGLFQMTKGTQKTNNVANPYNVADATKGEVRNWAQTQSYLSGKLHRPVTDGETKVGHIFGPKGGLYLLEPQNAEMKATDVLKAAGYKNPNTALSGALTAAQKRANPGWQNMTAARLNSVIENQFVQDEREIAANPENAAALHLNAPASTQVASNHSAPPAHGRQAYRQVLPQGVTVASAAPSPKSEAVGKLKLDLDTGDVPGV